ncbi:MAG: site-2 protease family protein [Luteolibacter sp.]
MFRFSIFGIPVEVQPFFWLTMILIGSGFTGGFSRGTPLEFLWIALFVLAGFISILVHELGHALTAKKFGVQPYIVLQAFGGYAAYPAGIMNRPQSFFITAAGPAIQLLLAGAVFLLFTYLFPTLNANLKFFLSSLYFVSFYWAILNLLPIVPMDGGQMLHSILGPQRVKITLWISIVTGVVLAVVVYKFTSSIIFPLFMAMFAWQAWQQLRLLR